MCADQSVTVHGIGTTLKQDPPQQIENGTFAWTAEVAYCQAIPKNQIRPKKTWTYLQRRVHPPRDDYRKPSFFPLINNWIDSSIRFCFV